MLVSDNSDLPENKQNTTLPDRSVAPGRIGTLLMRFGVIGELLVLFATGKRWWMAPLVLLLGVFGLLLALINSFEVVAPFIYMAF